MKYQLKKHGDSLEQHAADWVERTFPMYERVWSTYTGHKGNGEMADMPDYPDQLKRKRFSERSYTVLQSVMIINSIMKTGIFEKSHDNVETVLEFHKSLLAFYACIGRICDCVTRAGESIHLHGSEKDLKSFWTQRCTALHGRSIPLNIDDIGLPQLPDMNDWDDVNKNWGEAIFKNEYATDDIKNIFNELTVLLNNIYEKFYDVICAELKALGIKLEVKNFNTQYIDIATSGSTRTY